MDILQYFELFTSYFRVRLILLLVKQELCVCELQELFDVKQPLVSKQLSLLKELDLLYVRKDNKYIYYQIKSNPLFDSLLLIISNSFNNDDVIVEDQVRLKRLLENRKENCR